MQGESIGEVGGYDKVKRDFFRNNFFKGLIDGTLLQGDQRVGKGVQQRVVPVEVLGFKFLK